MGETNKPKDGLHYSLAEPKLKKKKRKLFSQKGLNPILVIVFVLLIIIVFAAFSDMGLFNKGKRSANYTNYFTDLQNIDSLMISSKEKNRLLYGGEVTSTNPSFRQAFIAPPVSVTATAQLNYINGEVNIPPTAVGSDYTTGIISHPSNNYRRLYISPTDGKIRLHENGVYLNKQETGSETGSIAKYQITDTKSLIIYNGDQTTTTSKAMSNWSPNGYHYNRGLLVTDVEDLDYNLFLGLMNGRKTYLGRGLESEGNITYPKFLKLSGSYAGNAYNLDRFKNEGDLYRTAGTQPTASDGLHNLTNPEGSITGYDVNAAVTTIDSVTVPTVPVGPTQTNTPVASVALAKSSVKIEDPYNVIPILSLAFGEGNTRYSSSQIADSWFNLTPINVDLLNNHSDLDSNIFSDTSDYRLFFVTRVAHEDNAKKILIRALGYTPDSGLGKDLFTGQIANPVIKDEFNQYMEVYKAATQTIRQNSVVAIPMHDDVVSYSEASDYKYMAFSIYD